MTLNYFYFRLKWDALVKPSIELAENGFKVNKYLGEPLVQFHSTKLMLIFYASCMRLFRKSTATFVVRFVSVSCQVLL